MKLQPLPSTLTVLAIMALAGSALACSSLPILRPTPTPTVTPSPTPTSTPSPTATATSTATPTPTPTPTTRTEQRKLEDGSIAFTDHQLGYSLVLPPHWAIIDLKQSDLEQMVKDMQAQDPALANMAELFVQSASDNLLFMAFSPDISEKQIDNVSTMLLIDIDALSSNYSPDLVVSLMGPSIESMIPDSKLKSAEVVEGVADFPVGWIEYDLPQQVGAQGSMFHEVMALFPAGDHYLGLVVACETSHYSEVEPLFKDTLKSIEFQ